jgi:glycosyltransferase involved in cell wall biosynthesis
LGALWRKPWARTAPEAATPDRRRPAISVCIPTYEMHGRGAAFLARSLAALDRQSLRDFEVIVSDHSQDAGIETLCLNRRQFYPLRYVRCPSGRGNSSVNTNFAVRQAMGDIIKIIHQDDFLFRDDALERIAHAMRAAPDRHWGGVGCVHVDETETDLRTPHLPSLNPMILHGHNSFGAPSVMFARREKFLEFDEELIWVSDCEHYYRMAEAWGEPILINDLLMAVRQWSGQVTHTAVSEDRKAREIRYAIEKHKPVADSRNG